MQKLKSLISLRSSNKKGTKKHQPLNETADNCDRQDSNFAHMSWNVFKTLLWPEICSVIKYGELTKVPLVSVVGAIYEQHYNSWQFQLGPHLKHE